MHFYGLEVSHVDSPFDLKLEPHAQCVECHSFVDLRPVFHRVEDMMRVLGYPFEDILAVQLAFREAAANAVKHGNEFDISRCVRVCYLVAPDEVALQVEDEGPGFDPNAGPRPAQRRLRRAVQAAGPVPDAGPHELGSFQRAGQPRHDGAAAIGRMRGRRMSVAEAGQAASGGRVDPPAPVRTCRSFAHDRPRCDTAAGDGPLSLPKMPRWR